MACYSERATSDMIESKAKDLFLKYDGNTFFMRREGDYDTYKAFQVPRETEISWIRDLHTSFLDQLAMSPLTAPQASQLILRYLTTISYTKDCSTVSTLIQMVAPKVEYDSFFKIRCAEEVIEACEYLESNGRIATQAARHFAEQLFQEVLDNPISIADEWRHQPHFPDTFNLDNIKRRALNGYDKSMCTQPSK